MLGAPAGFDAQRHRVNNKNKTVNALAGKAGYPRAVKFNVDNHQHIIQLEPKAETAVNSSLAYPASEASFASSFGRDAPKPSHSHSTAVTNHRFQACHIPNSTRTLLRTRRVPSVFLAIRMCHLINRSISSQLNSLNNMISAFGEGKSEKNQFIYIIGNNGSGKSTYLRECIDLFKDDFDKIIALPCGIFDKFNARSAGKYVYCGFRTNANSIFLTGIGKRITASILHLISRGKNKILQEILSDMQLHLKFESAGNLWDKRTRQERRTSEEEKRELEKIIQSYKWDVEGSWNRLEQDDAAFLRAGLGKDLRFSARFRVADKKDYISVESLSSGYLQKLNMILSIATEVENNSLIVIDEPEISLHVKWQAELPNVFREALSTLQKCVIIVATHSPLIVSKSTLEDDYIYVIPDGKTIESHYVNANIEKLLFDKFEYLPIASHVIPEICADFIHAVTRQPGLSGEFRRKVENIKARHTLSNTDRNFIEKTLGVIEIVEQNQG